MDRARTPRSRGRDAWPARRPRSTGSCTCAGARISRRDASPACASPRSKATSSSASAPSRSRPAVQRLALLVATVGGVGYAPIAPGTVASAVTVLALWVAPLSRSALVIVTLVVVAAGTWAAHEAERALGSKDPGAIVI